MRDGKPPITISIGRGKVLAMVVDDRAKKTLQANVEKNGREGSSAFTDELVAYRGLTRSM